MRKFTDKKGNFKPTKKPTKGKMNIQTLEECCEWIYENPEFPYEDKMKRILIVEGLIQQLLDDNYDIRITNIPIWSEKLLKNK